MSDFISILNFWRDCIIALFSLSIPLGSDLFIKWGSIVLGLMAFPIFLKVIFRLFSDAGAMAENEIARMNKPIKPSKGGKKK